MFKDRSPKYVTRPICTLACHPFILKYTTPKLHTLRHIRLSTIARNTYCTLRTKTPCNLEYLSFGFSIQCSTCIFFSNFDSYFFPHTSLTFTFKNDSVCYSFYHFLYIPRFTSFVSTCGPIQSSWPYSSCMINISPPLL